ncbi:hypothetical protein SCLCIDRAFT_1220034 [Scleroderma citrinum Foug A]|uniref:Uncharacterized protein n=1 Tax=Scleroderma citrinum Foug A TaxID=1036808 RepID=A0A0C2Z4A1_9AGAM|nr:hypothetical protein SCLCIDRAFT_1220034 [Scleroderma citrinum Foug A]
MSLWPHDMARSARSCAGFVFNSSRLFTNFGRKTDFPPFQCSSTYKRALTSLLNLVAPSLCDSGSPV